MGESYLFRRLLRCIPFLSKFDFKDAVSTFVFLGVAMLIVNTFAAPLSEEQRGEENKMERRGSGVTEAMERRGSGVTEAMERRGSGVTDAMERRGSGVTDAMERRGSGVTDAMER